MPAANVAMGDSASNMLSWRLALGALFVLVLAAWLWIDHNYTQPVPGVWLAVLGSLITVAASGEVLRLLRSATCRPSAPLVYFGNLLIVASPWLALAWPDSPLGDLGWPLLALTACFLLALLEEVLRYERGVAEVTHRLALTSFCLLYVGLSLSFVVQLRLVDGGAAGILLVATMIVVVKMSDIGAYTIGRLFGRHKLATELSPKKTLEGVAGGFLFAWLAAWCCYRWLIPQNISPAPVWGWLVFAPVVTMAGILGDLTGSLLKRAAGQKDSSTWMPGFGGVIDLLDSPLLAAPVTYGCWLFGLLGR